MNPNHQFHSRFSHALAVAVLLASTCLAGTSHVWAQVPIVKPGAPGEASRTISAAEAVEIAESSYTPADVKFMQDMIPHHHQATQMAALVAQRSNNPDLAALAGKINVTQADEILFMQGWLEQRGETVPNPADHAGMHMHHDMAGMASPEQMVQLADSQGADFDRLFLELMIRHHDGALTMVDDLNEQPGSTYDPVLFEFTTDVVNDQALEIERMNGMLVELSDDPRAGLSAGIFDAGEAIMNLNLIASLRKPDGFFDPNNPAERGSQPAKDEEKKDSEEDSAKPIEEAAKSRRLPMLSFSNTDMAFAGNILVAGNYHGFNIYELNNSGLPQLASSVVCPGGQGDVSIVGHLLIMSVEQTRGRLDCDLQGVTEDVSEERFRGIRIFDISDVTQPLQVGAVQTCRGSHTHSVVSGPDENGIITVYNSGTSGVREEEELPGCIGEEPGDEGTALFSIDVIEIPVSNPAAARVVTSPRVFADPQSGVVAGLWRGGDHGDDTQETNVTDQCHDITVFPELHMAAGACSGNGILFDTTDPADPQRMDVVTDEGFAYWHSATFNNDGSKVLFTDEWGGGMRPRCRAWDPLTWGANAIYDIVDGKLKFRSHFKIPAPQVETENCVAHNGSIIPVPGRDIFVQAWYQGGISVIDFTDSSKPMEIAFFDRGPYFDDELITGGFWSVYWYQGKIYGTEIVRGLDVLELLPSEYLSSNEIAAAMIADQGEGFNPQQQFMLTWPADPVVARAYLDQLVRNEIFSEVDRVPFDGVLDQVDVALAGGHTGLRMQAADRLQALTAMLGSSDEANGVGAEQISGLLDTMYGIVARLRS